MYLYVYIYILTYADDIIILGNTQLEVRQTMEKLVQANKEIELNVNEAKTKYIVKSLNPEDIANLKVEHFVFEKVEDFKYLVVNINHRNNTHSEIWERINAVN